MHALAEARAFAAAGDRIWQQKCTAQSLGMMREARGTRTLLLRLQSAREQREKDATACDRAAWNEHCVINLMRQGLADAEPGANPNHGATPPAPSSDPPPPVSAPAEPARGRQIHRFATVPADVPSAPPRPVAGPAVLDRIAPRPSALDSA
jgi:hypothetical protein